MDNMRKWVSALRSGEYRQAQEQLRVQGDDGTYSYCCLGVACDLAAKDGVTVGDDGYGWNAGVLPEAVQEWLDIDEDDPILSGADLSGMALNAIYLNDNLRLSFIEIADAIERTYLQ